MAVARLLVADRDDLVLGERVAFAGRRGGDLAALQLAIRPHPHSALVLQVVRVEADAAILSGTDNVDQRRGVD
ncbi:hypothetical protein [Streptomyces davaonensis]|uniref:hypothetical protein n=1 Tax=Streptomyces davaonensis TaxID=348043 RepID=UPI0012FF61D7|nr:hypothetical protein [Streptomyces davaonensis]